MPAKSKSNTKAGAKEAPGSNKSRSPLNKSDDSSKSSVGKENGDEMKSIPDLTKPDPIDEEKLENFRRLASAEEMEDFDNTFYNASDEAFDVTGDSGVTDLSNMDPEQKAKLEEEWRTELARTEEEIQTLRQVLSSKLRNASELKRKLGITVWKEFQQDIGQGVKSIQESTASGLGIFSAPAYQKTTETVKTVGERTTSVLGSLGGSVARKLGEVKNSNAFKSFEERVVSATGTIKDRMTGSRSNSTNSFEDALNSSERRNSQTATPATTPTIPEEKTIS